MCMAILIIASHGNKTNKTWFVVWAGLVLKCVGFIGTCCVFAP